VRPSCRRWARPALLLVLLAWAVLLTRPPASIALPAAAPSAAARSARGAAISDRRAPPSHRRGVAASKRRARSAPTAPSGPPLVSGEGAYAEGGEEESEAQAPPTGSEPLVDNGLGSPLCASPAALSAAARRNCETSDFVAASAPGIDYGLDVHIDQGPLGLDGESLFQSWLVKRPWNVLVWAVHAVLVAIEWSFTIDLLSSPAMGAVATALRDAQRDFTQPWIAAALAVAAVLVAWRGIVRGRVAQSAAEALSMLAMMACGLWMIADPIGTVGAVARWADLAGAQALGAVSSGSSSRAPASLADSMGQLFGATVNGPWCYLEFGDVSWCDDPARLDSRLRASAMKIASEKGREAGSAGPSAPGARGAAARSAELLRSATTNGELFLALPANGPERNSINDEGSLLYALCQSPNATGCRGPTAAEAEFRTPRGTGERFVGIILIAAGIVGMLLLFGFVVMRMLGASLLALLLLLAAPIVVLAPALGDGGRTLFRQWAARLLGAAGSKLVWSFLLGVLLVAMRAILVLHGLGWWVQWLLLCILWWGSFLQRHRILVPSGGDRGADLDPGGPIRRAYRAGRRVVRTGRGAGKAAHWTRDRVRDHTDGSRRRREQERNAPDSPPDSGRGRGREEREREKEERDRNGSGLRDEGEPRRDEHDRPYRDEPDGGKRRGDEGDGPMSPFEVSELEPRGPGGGASPRSGDGGSGEVRVGPAGETGGSRREGSVGERGHGEKGGSDREVDAGRSRDLDGRGRRTPHRPDGELSNRQGSGDAGSDRFGADGGGSGRHRARDGGDRDPRQGEGSTRPPSHSRHVPRQEREQRLQEIVDVLRRGGGGERPAEDDERGKQSRSAIDRRLRERRESERGSVGERRRRQFDWEDS